MLAWLKKAVTVQERLHAVMPDKFIEKQVKDLRIGESGYLEHYDISVDVKRRIWIDPCAPLDKNYRSGVVVERTENGYEVKIGHGVGRWNPKNDYHASIGYQPVAKIHVLDQTWASK